jgi:hypothetical protein
MSYVQYPKSDGALFTNNERTKDTQPHYRGNVKVTTEQINKLIEMINAGLEPALQLSAWSRKSAAGMDYISISAEAYMKDSPPAPPPQIQPPVQPQPVQAAPVVTIQPVAPVAPVQPVAPVVPVAPQPIQPVQVQPATPTQPASGFVDDDIPF